MVKHTKHKDLSQETLDFLGEQLLIEMFGLKDLDKKKKDHKAIDLKCRQSIHNLKKRIDFELDMVNKDKNFKKE